MFAGPDAGGARAAALYSLVGAAKCWRTPRTQVQMDAGASIGNFCFFFRDEYVNLPCLLVYKTQISPFPGRAFLLTFINFAQ